MMARSGPVPTLNALPVGKNKRHSGQSELEPSTFLGIPLIHENGEFEEERQVVRRIWRA